MSWNSTLVLLSDCRAQPLDRDAAGARCGYDPVCNNAPMLRKTGILAGEPGWPATRLAILDNTQRVEREWPGVDPRTGSVES